MIIRVTNGRIHAVESSESSRLFLNGAELSLPDRAWILPGFVDTHCHLIGPGMMAERVDLRGAESAAECLERTRKEIGHRSRNEWVLGFGWNQEGWKDLEKFNRGELDKVAPDNPVMLYRIDTHAAWLNSHVLRAAGLEEAREIEGGEVLRDKEGKPTGIILDHAIKIVERQMPSSTPTQIARWYRYGAEECLRYGITEVHDMTVSPDWIEPLIHLSESGDLPIRCQLFLDGLEERWEVAPEPAMLGPNLQTAGIKFFSDGALGSRGAYLLEPYSDEPGTRGIRMMEPEEIIELSRKPVDAGYGVATHAIGDGANRLVLDAYQVLREEFPDALLRIEHAQIVHPDDLSRFAELDVIPTIQSTHCTSDAEMAEARLGEERCGYAYGWKGLRDQGLPLLGGSDFPIESPDPLLGLRAFVERKAKSGPWHTGQAISRKEALQTYTEWAPLGVPSLPNRGRLEPGCDADLVVLSGDPFEEGTEVVMTIVGGELRYRA